MMLKNVELSWVKLDPSAPDGGFDGNTPQWQITASTDDKGRAAKWSSAGMNVKERAGKFEVKLKKLATRKDGSAEKPVPVFDAELSPIEDVRTIGNGSVANVRVRTFDYNYNGRSGTGFRLDAIQIVDLVEFKSDFSGTSGFEPISFASSEGDIEDDVY